MRALAKGMQGRRRWQGGMLRPKAQGGGQLRLALTAQERWEMVNKSASSLQGAHNTRS